MGSGVEDGHRRHTAPGAAHPSGRGATSTIDGGDGSRIHPRRPRLRFARGRVAVYRRALPSCGLVGRLHGTLRPRRDLE